jgi:hypothetical protein
MQQQRQKVILEDITRYPFQGGEWIVTFDPDHPTEDYRIVVDTVDPGAQGTVVLRCRMVSNDSTRYQAGDQILITLDPHGKPFMGMVVPQGGVDQSAVLNGYSNASNITYQIIVYFKQFVQQNRRGKYTEKLSTVLSWLQSQGHLPASEVYFDPKGDPRKPYTSTYRKRAAWIRKAISSRKDYLLVCRNQYIEYVPTANNAAVKPGVFIKDQTDSNIKIVNREKFVEGIILIAESGLLGNIRWS